MKYSLKRTIAYFAAALLLSGAAAGLYFFAAAHPAWVAQSFLPWSRRAIHTISSVNGWLPFSAAEFLIYGAIIAAAAWIISVIVRVCKKKIPPRALLRMLAVILLIAGGGALFYEGVWAAGYHSLPLSYSLGYSVRPYSRDELRGAAEWMLEAVNSEVGNVSRDENGVMLGVPFAELSDMVCDSWEALSAENEFFATFSPVAAKPVAASKLMSYADITGIFFAFTGEANINADAPANSIPFTAAHELAHAAMVCPENEANFAAWLACRESPHSEFRYSGALSAFIYLYNSLYRESRDEAYELYYKLDPRAMADIAYRSEYWAAHKGWLEKVSTAANNTYLKVMAQPEGVKSYGMVSDLLICEYLASEGAAY